ncbi:MAG: glycosyltransferase family 39 protein [Desulfurobacteriaceae bacterium]
MKNKRFLLLLILSFLLLVLPNGFFTCFDKDEPKYLEAAREMIEKGDYITPYYNYEYRFDKPILVYWLIVLGYKLFGINEFGGGFFVSIFGVFTVLILYWWLRRWKSENLAFWSALTLLSMVYFVGMATVAMPDVVLLFFITASLIFFFEGYHRKKEEFYLLAFASSGMATLTKGPVGIVLPGIIAVVYLTLRRDLIRTLKEIPWIKGFTIFFLIVTPWYFAVLKKHGYHFFKDFVLFHNVHRFLSKVPGHPTQWWYYLANYVWIYLPWSLVFPFAVYKAFKERKFITDNVIMFSVVWFFGVFTFFQIAHTKLTHYLLPSFPAFSVVVSWYLLNFEKRLVNYLIVLLLVIASVVVTAAFTLKGFPPISYLLVAPTLLAAIILIFKKSNPLKIAVVFLILTSLSLKWIVLPSLQELRAKPQAGELIRDLAKNCQSCKFYFLHFRSPEVVYHFRTGKLENIHDFRKAEEMLKSEEPVVFVTRENRLKNIKNTRFYLLFKKEEFLTKRKIVVISNYPKEKLNARE